MTDFENRVARLFADHFGSPPTEIDAVAADSSSRRYVRLVGPGGERAIGAFGPGAEENRAFLSFSRSLRGAGLRVPEIYADDVESGVWLAQDLGDLTLLDALTEARARTGDPFPAEMRGLFSRVLEELLRLQVEGAKVIDFTNAYPRADFDEQSILWDLNYFKYHFLRLADVPFNEGRLERDFHQLAAFALEADTNHFLHRDFQARNVMLIEHEPWFIDYQGGRRGALQYDVASLLYSGSSGLPEDARTVLLESYLDALEGTGPAIDRAEWRRHYRAYGLVRVMQAMGLYGYRGIFQRRARFVKRIPTAARSLRDLTFEGLPTPVPELEAVLSRIADRWSAETAGARVEPEAAAPLPPPSRPRDVGPERTADRPTGDEERPALTVHLSSFSYRRGYPEDAVGHGGGFIFDCRSLPNPGREERYHFLTGLDPEVVQYLEREAAVDAFWEHTRALVEAHVESYRQRGFGDLSVAYGCTGGQHRSVYFVERTARHLEDRFPVEVRIVHREASIWPREPGAEG